DAALDNQGQFLIGYALNWLADSSAQTNEGTIVVSGGNLKLDQTGTNPGFTNTGTIEIDPGRTLTITSAPAGGPVDTSEGALTGDGALSVNMVTAALGTSLAISVLTANASTLNVTGDLSDKDVTLTSSTLNVTGRVIIGTGRTLSATSSTLNVAGG